jgi:hypothetical protein
MKLEMTTHHASIAMLVSSVALDHVDRKMHLVPNVRFRSPDHVGASGVGFPRPGRHYEVQIVLPDSAASRAVRKRATDPRASSTNRRLELCCIYGMADERTKSGKGDAAPAEPQPTFDEGGSRPAPVESTGHDNVRSMPLSSPANPDDSAGDREGGEDLDPQMTD